MRIGHHNGIMPNGPKPKPQNSAADLIGLGSNASRIDLMLDGDEYQGIDEKSGAKMLGYFTQTMKSQGFPWRLQESSSKGIEGKLNGTNKLSDMDALRRIQKGEPVVFQPMRNLKLDLSSDSIGAIAAAGSIGTGVEMSSMAKLANVTKNTRVSAGSQGLELKHGEPIEISSLSELKLLYQMYNPDETLNTKDTIGKTAHQLAHFNQQNGDYGWRFYQKEDTNAAARISKAFGGGLLRGAAMGAAVGAMVGLPLGLFTQSIQNATIALGIGAAAFGGYGAVEAARTASKGRPLNTTQALEAVLKDQPIEIQETQIRGIGVPVLGKVSWLSDRGLPSTVHDAKELETMWWMQNQSAKELEEPKPAAPPTPTTAILIDQSQHYYNR
jgi:hypothetical protein